jgi:putative heme-binding domain-containing protein
MKAFTFPRFFCLLVAAAAFALRAQDHIDYDPPTPAMGAYKAKADAEKDTMTPANGQFKGRGRGRGGAPDAAAKKGGGRGVSAADLEMDLEKIIANPADLAKGQRIFEQQCVVCHGPKGEGDRGPRLAQPTLPRAEDDRTLIQIVARGIPNTEMPGGRMKAGEAPYLAAYVRSLGRIPQEKVPGDPANGLALVKSKGACLTCHTISGEGTAAIGPDLTDIGARRSPNFLRRALMDPSADVPLTAGPGNFAFIKVKTLDGREASGVRVNEGTFYVQFRDITGALWSFSKSELAEFHSDRTSPMPVYTGLFTPAEMDDVIAYLVSLRGKKM